MFSVAVVLAHYDDETYIDEQIASLADQKGVQIHLVVGSDGGSQPNYSELLPAKRRGAIAQADIRKNASRVGFANNFMVNAKFAPQSEFYSFSDQDDIWFSDKLSRAIEKILEHPQDRPVLYCSRTQITDVNAERDLGLSPNFSRAPSFKNALVQNIGGGNTMVMNQAAWDLALKVNTDKPVVSHDWWCYQIVSGSGGVVIFDKLPSIKYRQHDKNIVGENNNWLARTRRIKALFRGQLKEWNESNLIDLKANKCFLTEANKQALQDFDTARQSTLLKRLFLMKRSGVYRQTMMGNLGLIVATIINKV